MRALIVGPAGLVGHSLWRAWRERQGWEVRGTYLSHRLSGLEPLDACDSRAVKALLHDARPDAVVLAASNPHVDYCEGHPEETRKINVEMPLCVAELSREIGARFVFFSSDYVFDGSWGSYGEEDLVHPVNEYGRQKIEADRGIAGVTEKHLILRISGAFGWELVRKNFVLQVLDRAASGQPLRVATDVVYCPTYAPTLAPVLAWLLEQGACDVYHAVGQETK